MTKSDLKNGMVVRFREGNYYLYLQSCENYYEDCGGILINITRQGWIPISDYNDDLTIIEEGDYRQLDIVAVYNPYAHQISGFINDPDHWNFGEPIWEEGYDVGAVEVNAAGLL